MSILKHYVSTPQTNHHKPNCNSYNVSSNTRSFSISPPARRVIYVTDFHYLLIIYSTNESVELRDGYGCIQTIIYAIPNNQSFSQEPIYWGKTSLASHEDGPPPSRCSRALRLPFKIPNILWTSPFYGGGRGSCDGPHNLSPHSKVHLNVDKHVSPQCAKVTNPSPVLHTQRHLKQPHMPDTTISKQSFQACLGKRGKTSNNHRKNPKESQSTSKGAPPQSLPVYSPKSKNSNFGHYCNPLRNTRPCTSINIGDPEMQRRCSLFPKQSHAHKPDTQQQ